MSLNSDLYDSKVDRAAMLRLHENQVLNEVKAELKNGLIDLEDLIKRQDLIKRLSPELREELDLLITKKYANLRSLQSSRLSRLFSDQAGYLTSALGVKAGALFEIHKPVCVVDESFVLGMPLYKNTTLETGWKGLSVAERQRVEQVIRAGAGAGKNIAEIARGVRGAAAVSIPHAVGLARTSVTSIAAQADLAVYKANEKLLRGYQYVAVLDSRTTPVCAARDGKIYELEDKAHLPPAHWNCRSTTVPVVRSLDDLNNDNSILHLRKRNMSEMTDKQRAYYDGLAYSDAFTSFNT